MGDKIVLTMDLPINLKHGAFKGEVFEVTRIEREIKKINNLAE